MSSLSASPRILVCDDDALFRKTLDLMLRSYGSITLTANSDEAMQILRKKKHDLLILDVQMRTPDEGLHALPLIRAIDAELPVLVMSGLNDFQTVREALRRGASDYVVKGGDPEEFKLAVERAFEKNALQKSNQKQRHETQSHHARYAMIGESVAVLAARKLIEKFRASPANVLITGETGTGKEIAARLLRKTLPNGDLEPFIAIDSATLHSNTAESLLFGHEKGAFTGADQQKKGLFEEANGGVIFFDEIGNLPLPIQAKLLRVLQEKEITRLGSTRVIPLEFRVIAATNRDLELMAKDGTFLPDLLQRLNVLPITLPPLRERNEDIPALVAHFLKRKAGGQVSVTEEAITAMRAYAWPGNIRELSAHLDYSLAMIDGSEIDVADLHPKIREGSRMLAPGKRSGFYEQLEDFERGILSAAYQMNQGNVSQMALALSMDRSHLHTKLKQYGIHQVRK